MDDRRPTPAPRTLPFSEKFRSAPTHNAVTTNAATRIHFQGKRINPQPVQPPPRAKQRKFTGAACLCDQGQASTQLHSRRTPRTIRPAHRVTARPPGVIGAGNGHAPGAVAAAVAVDVAGHPSRIVPRTLDVGTLIVHTTAGQTPWQPRSTQVIVPVGAVRPIATMPSNAKAKVRAPRPVVQV